MVNPYALYDGINDIVVIAIRADKMIKNELISSLRETMKWNYTSN
ncbi:hypothetical protein PPIS_a0111 [Pseudoalteromonas piscicida]|uniref:Uncharacterized protein n=1 Tax=Pseudoalteromonas piscicida TaxID=43662 RepID=A0ABN5C9E2_PSEO7|nr:hypothetical protein PPIS_a0111 [Pseudoalteromonas piscicida]